MQIRESASARKGEGGGRIVNFGETPRSRSKQANPFVCSFVRRESEGHESADALSSSPHRSSAADKFRLRARGKKQEAREVAELAIRGRQGKNPFLKPRFPPHPIYTQPGAPNRICMGEGEGEEERCLGKTANWAKRECFSNSELDC